MFRPTGDWRSSKLLDMLGKPFTIGDHVVKAYSSGRAVNLTRGIVTRIEDGKMYLDNSHVAIHFPGRLLIINKLLETNADVGELVDSLDSESSSERSAGSSPVIGTRE